MKFRRVRGQSLRWPLSLLKQHPEIRDPKNLQSYFFRELIKRLEKRNLEIHGWEEVALMKTPQGPYAPNPEFANKKRCSLHLE